MSLPKLKPDVTEVVIVVRVNRLFDYFRKSNILIQVLNCFIHGCDKIYSFFVHILSLCNYGDRCIIPQLMN